jgi:DNA processing protein
MNNTSKWIWLAEKCGQGSSEVLHLLEGFESVGDIYSADYDAYVGAGLSERLAEDLSDKSLDSAMSIQRMCQMSRIGVLCYDDEKFPSSLRSLKNPPLVLYYTGRLPDFNKALCVAMVGTRSMSEYGMRAAYKIAYEIASSGAVVVSGMALGIDGISAAGAISAGGSTVAVLGCGIDVTYPKQHARLRERIERSGAVITEYPPSTEPRGMNFPVRNRIISGLSQGVLVVDADEGSGAMITAKSAIMQGRDIYAVPCNIDSENSSGTNQLIRDGAQAVLCGYDVVKNYAFVFRDRLNIQKMRDAEKRSQFDPDAIAEMGVSAAGAAKYILRSNGAQSNDTQPKNKPNPDKKLKREEEKIKSPKSTGNDTLVATAVPEGQEPRKTAVDSAALESLSEKQRRIFDEMPLDRAVTVDYLTKSGFKLGEVISALTVLEIKGFISSLPGALYVRK